MRSILIFLAIVLLAGCGQSGKSVGTDVTPQEEAREKSYFWQLEEPRVQLDPVEEEEVPAVIKPALKEENPDD